MKNTFLLLVGLVDSKSAQKLLQAGFSGGRFPFVLSAADLLECASGGNVPKSRRNDGLEVIDSIFESTKVIFSCDGGAPVYAWSYLSTTGIVTGQ